MVFLSSALLGTAAVGLFFTCTNNTILPGQNGTINGLCTYPRGCYVVNASGPNMGQCDDDACYSVPKTPCRLIFSPADPFTYDSSAGDPAGTWVLTGGQPSPADWQAVCGWNSPPPDGGPGYTPPAGKVSVCADPELICVARGTACSGFCVHLTGSSPLPDGGAAPLCASSVPIPPQRRPGATDGGTQTYCPLIDDVCCPGPMPMLDGGGAMDGGAMDGGAMDGGAADLAAHD